MHWILGFLFIAQSQAAPDFLRDVRPLLSQHCFPCHGPDEGQREAELRLDLEASAKGDRGGSFAVRPGDPGRSELIARITATDDPMPPRETGDSLTPAEIALLTTWVESGASWQAPWAYEMPTRASVPVAPAEPDAPASRNDRGRHFIDDLLDASQTRAGVAAVPEADRRTLIRRLSFDLTGLPRTPEQVESFVASDHPAAYEATVDALLASPAYGERMAIYWLDLVRYADTVGYHGDQEHHISPYRDWVIDALNADLPFDRFTRMQLAGDLIAEAGVEGRIASGYNRLLQTSHEGGVQPKEYIAIYAADRVRNVSAVWMAATMGCAQCHDHKFDPYTAEDFYSMGAFFADVDDAHHLTHGRDSSPTVRQPEEKVTTSSGERLTMITRALEQPRTMRVLPRGNWLDDSGEIVEPRVPRFLPQIVAEGRATRLDLAHWFTSAEGIGPLTARVFANRVWYLLFGEGLAPVLDDFGGQGEAPSQPELLDRLALEFIDGGWSLKHLVKTIVMSRAYRRSSVVPEELTRRDPYNSLFARQGSHRLPAEMIRDNALAVSGLLVTGIGGASVKPYQPLGYYRHLNFPKRKYAAHQDTNQWRRGVYVHWQRQFLHPALKALDAPGREECTARRTRSNTPLAALALLNDPSFVEAARVLSQRILVEGGKSTDDRLRYAFRRVLARMPERYEQQVLIDLLAANQKIYRDSPDLAKAVLEVGLAPVDSQLDSTEVAAWTAVARALLNLHETITRS